MKGKKRLFENSSLGTEGSQEIPVKKKKKKKNKKEGVTEQGDKGNPEQKGVTEQSDKGNTGQKGVTKQSDRESKEQKDVAEQSDKGNTEQRKKKKKKKRKSLGDSASGIEKKSKLEDDAATQETEISIKGSAATKESDGVRKKSKSESKEDDASQESDVNFKESDAKGESDHEWKKEDVLDLIKHMDEKFPDIALSLARKRLKWQNLNVNGHSPESCKDLWTRICSVAMQHITIHKMCGILSEILENPATASDFLKEVLLDFEKKQFEREFSGAPVKPKGQLNSYNYYLSMMKKDRPDTSFKEVATMWADLTDEEKKEYAEKAHQQNTQMDEEYSQKLEEYKESLPDDKRELFELLTKEKEKKTKVESQGASLKISGAAVKDKLLQEFSGAPVRPTGSGSGYSLFTVSFRKEFPQVTFKEVGARWKALSDEEKEKYVQEAHKLKEEYDTEVKEFLKTLPDERRERFKNLTIGIKKSSKTPKKKIMKVKMSVVMQKEDKPKQLNKNEFKKAELLYLKEKKGKMENTHPEMEEENILALLAEKFKQLPYEKQAKYLSRANLLALEQKRITDFYKKSLIERSPDAKKKKEKASSKAVPSPPIVTTASSEAESSSEDDSSDEESPINEGTSKSSNQEKVKISPQKKVKQPVSPQKASKSLPATSTPYTAEGKEKSSEKKSSKNNKDKKKLTSDEMFTTLKAARSASENKVVKSDKSSSDEKDFKPSSQVTKSFLYLKSKLNSISSTQSTLKKKQESSDDSSSEDSDSSDETPATPKKETTNTIQERKRKRKKESL